MSAVILTTQHGPLNLKRWMHPPGWKVMVHAAGQTTAAPRPVSPEQSSVGLTAHAAGRSGTCPGSRGGAGSEPHIVGLVGSSSRGDTARNGHAVKGGGGRFHGQSQNSRAER